MKKIIVGGIVIATLSIAACGGSSRVAPSRSAMESQIQTALTKQVRDIEPKGVLAIVTSVDCIGVKDNNGKCIAAVSENGTPTHLSITVQSHDDGGWIWTADS
jgi:hypothetical protein